MLFPCMGAKILIKSQTFEVKLNVRNREHYIGLGFCAESASVEVDASNLHRTSKYLITAICDDCGSERTVQFAQYRPTCRTCAVRAANKKNIKPRPNCKFCGVELKYLKSTSCITCHRANFPSGEEAYTWKGGKPNCACCGAELSNWGAPDGSFCGDCRRAEQKAAGSGSNEREHQQRVFARNVKSLANYTCDICGSGESLHAHHLESYDKNESLRTDLSNGVCLCRVCHIDFHKTYGFGDNTSAQYQEYKEAL